MISLLETVLIEEIQVFDEEIIVSLITIYDKADTADISDKELKDLIKAFHQNG